MANPIIKCTLPLTPSGNFVVTYTGFIFENTDLARSINPAHVSTMNRSINGSTSLSGRRHTPGHIWTIAVAALFKNEDLADKTRELYWEYERQRKDGLKPKILIEDTSEYFFERGPRTRALADGADEIATTTGIKYYAKFYAHFNENPPTFQVGEGFVLQLEESGEVVSPS